MKIVIELNELFYDILTRCDESYSDKFHKAIRKGTILPKVHGRLIDADALIEQIKKSICIDCNSIDGVRCRACQYDDEMSDIDAASTIIEADKELEQPDKCKFFKDADCCYPIEDCDNCPNHIEGRKEVDG